MFSLRKYRVIGGICVFFFSNVCSSAHAFSYNVIDLGIDNIVGMTINEKGQIAGNFNNGRAFIYSIENGFTSLPTLFSRGSDRGEGLNNLGQLAGISYKISPSGVYSTSSAIYTPGSGVTNTGSLNGGIINNGKAYDINSSGYVTGITATNIIRPVAHAYLYKPESGMIDIDNLGSVYSYGTSINELGQITGTRGFPNSSTPGSIAEQL
ncbi:MAG: hypothetical protein V4525_10460 [Pseudomonadota bacterium]